MPIDACTSSMGFVVTVLFKSLAIWGVVGALSHPRSGFPAAVRCKVRMVGATALALLPLLELGMPLLGFVLPLGDAPGVRSVTDQPTLPTAGFLSADTASAPIESTWWILAIVWLTGCLLVLFRYGQDVVARRGVEHGSTRVKDAREAHLHALQSSLGVTRTIMLVETETVAVPLTWGWRRPVIVLPVRSREWPVGRLQNALRHELAHVRRADHPVRMLLQWECALCWFNPLLWLTAAGVRLEQERSCDDQVLRMGGRPSEYAYDLLEIARIAVQGGWRQVSAAGAHHSVLHARIEAIVDGGRGRVRLNRSLTGLVLASVIAVTLLVTAIEFGLADARHAVLRRMGAPGDQTVLLSVPSRSRVRLELFDTTGNRVALLLDNTLDRGLHEVAVQGTSLEGHRLAAGTYFCRLETDSVVSQISRIRL